MANLEIGNVADFALACCSIISIFCSLIIIGSYFSFRSLRSKSALLLLWLSTATIGFNSAMITLILQQNDNRKPKVFVPSGFFSIFFCLATCFWSAAITDTVSMVSLRRNLLLSYIDSQTRIVSTKSVAMMRMIRYHLYIWIIAGICALCPTVSGAFVYYLQDWTWFSAALKFQLIGIFTYYLPLALVTAANIYVWIRISASTTGSFLEANLLPAEDRLSIQLIELVEALKYFPLVSVFLSGLTICVQVVRLLSTDQINIQWLYFLAAVLQQSQGTFHLIVYAFRPAVRSAWWSLLFFQPPIGGSTTDPNSSDEVKKFESISPSSVRDSSDFVPHTRIDSGESNGVSDVESSFASFLSPANSPYVSRQSFGKLSQFSRKDLSQLSADAFPQSPLTPCVRSLLITMQMCLSLLHYSLLCAVDYLNAQAEEEEGDAHISTPS